MEYIKRVLKAIIGLIIISFGIYLTIQANIGLAPWDVLSMGIANVISLSYGDIVTLTGFIILLLALLMKEKVGIGTILDITIIGKTIDLFRNLDIVPKQDNIWFGILTLILGMFIIGFAAYIYMSAAISCGPRDAFMVGVGKKFDRIPIGVVKISIESIALMIGWLLGGQVGFGTIIAVFGSGLALQLVFKIVSFNPKTVEHDSLMTTMNWIKTSFSD